MFSVSISNVQFNIIRYFPDVEKCSSTLLDFGIRLRDCPCLFVSPAPHLTPHLCRADRAPCAPQQWILAKKYQKKERRRKKKNEERHLMPMQTTMPPLQPLVLLLSRLTETSATTHKFFVILVRIFEKCFISIRSWYSGTSARGYSLHLPPNMYDVEKGEQYKSKRNCCWT